MQFRSCWARVAAILFMLAPAPLWAAGCVSDLSTITVSSASLNASGPANQKRPGTVLGQNSYIPPRYTFGDLSTCTKSFKREIIVNGNVVPGINYNGQAVFESGIPGIGFAFAFVRQVEYSDGSGAGFPMAVNSQVQAVNEWRSPSNIVRLGGDTWTVTWIVTDRLVPGTHTRPSNLIATLRHTGDGIPGSIDVPIFVPAKATFTTSGCRMTTGSPVNVHLSGITSAELKEVGAESSPMGQFSIGIQCDGGISVRATMTDVSNPTNTSDILRLSGESKASGIGLKLYRGGQPAAVKFGPDSSAAGTTNQWLVGNSSSVGSVFSLPFAVRYVKTAPNVQAGPFRAASSITFSYQ